MASKTILITASLVLIILSFSLVSSALVIESVSQDKLYPGSEAGLDVKVKNDLSYDLSDVKLILIFNSLTQTGAIDFTKPTVFSSVGSSQDTQDIDEDDSETFNFQIKASNSAEPGDYSIGYVISYENANDTIVQETGTIGVTVNSKTLIDYSVKQDMKVIGMDDKITLKIINKGFGEVKFVSVELDDSSSGFTLLSEEKIYIGSIDSDDSDTAGFDVILNKANPVFTATVTYKDFENNDKTQTISFDLTAYSREKALELGLIKKNNSPIIFGVIVLIVVIWLVVRAVRRRRKRKSNELKNSGGM